MNIRQFLACTQSTSAGRRAEAASALTRAYLYGNLEADAAWEAKTAILALLDDPAPVVRRAMAEACEGAPQWAARFAQHGAVEALRDRLLAVDCIELAEEVGALLPSYRKPHHQHDL